MTERTCGLNTRENAGISSERLVRIQTVENLRIPGEGSSAQGKSGPKARPKGVVDGQQVKIPALWWQIEIYADTSEEDNQGRGKTWPARGSETISSEVSRGWWREKAYMDSQNTRTANRHR